MNKNTTEEEGKKMDDGQQEVSGYLGKYQYVSSLLKSRAMATMFLETLYQRIFGRATNKLVSEGGIKVQQQEGTRGNYEMGMEMDARL